MNAIFLKLKQLVNHLIGKGYTHEILTKLIKIKHRRGKDKIPNNHLQPNVGITAIAIPTVKHDPIDQKNCGIHSKGSQFQIYWQWAF